MKKFLIALIVIAAMGCTERACIAEFIEEKVSKDWFSGIITNENITAAVTATMSFDESSYLIISYYPGSCKHARISLFFRREKGNGYEPGVPIPGRLRIDRKENIYISYRGRTDGETFFLDVAGVTEKELLQGRRVYFEAKPPKGDALYSEFSLSGMATAYERAKTRCSGLREPEEGYFLPEDPGIDTPIKE